MKIAIIGAGSIGFTRRLFQDIVTVPELANASFALMDINAEYLELVYRLIERDIAANGLPTRVSCTTDRREALRDADYVFNTSRIGGLDAFQLDIDIPLKYGVDQCVGDTLCAGGIMYGQRNIPQILAFCRDIREVAKPDALFLNYANPNAMNTWAANHYGGVRTVGLCHGVQGGIEVIAKVIESVINEGVAPDAAGYRRVTRHDLDYVCAGINHQTWYIHVLYNGEDWATRLLEGFERHPEYSRTEKVRIDMIRRFGYFSTESNGHLSEYLPWYRKRSTEIPRWIEMSTWINGETGGYLREVMAGREWFVKEAPGMLAQPATIYAPEKRSHEHGSYIIEGLETGRVYRGHFNVVKHGTISNLPDDCIVEVPGYVDRNGLNIPCVGDLPLGCAAVCNASISVQRLAVEAAVHGDVTLLKQAMMLDPLVGAVCDPYEISQMTDEMLVAQAQWLPQYAAEVPHAAARLAAETPLGTHGTAGAARKKA
ncbi:MAG: alpha-glucosidase/alpha-galactosidase [Chloroflexi bacterium]|nr:alpha-glucosidase/alpha-galactosidase [Chloroflexota bacterium]